MGIIIPAYIIAEYKHYCVTRTTNLGMMKTSDQYKTVNYLATSELAFVNVQSQLKVERLS